MKATNLVIQAAQFPPTFTGSPAEFFELMVTLLKIVSPTGTNFFYIGDAEPTSNVGPWLKSGDRWYVFDEDLKRYVPINVSDSETKWYKIGASTPSDSLPPVWLRTTQDASEESPTYGEAVGWYFFNGTTWVPFNSIVRSGTTAERPTSPISFQQYYDTDIQVLIWWERSAWRTVSGVPGDVKSVAYETLSEALLHNPGWQVLGASNAGVRGRWISQATKDPGADPETSLTVGSGVAQRAAFETFGETDGVQINSSSDVPYPPTIALWHLVKN
jgi:hypothetical protein